MNRAKLLLFTLFIALTTSVNAQWGFGLKAGADYNSVTRSAAGRVDVTFHENIGLDYGIVARYQFNDWLALRADVEMLTRSHTMKRNIAFLEDVFTCHKNQYLTVPVMADFSFGGTKLRGHFMMGAFAGYWMSANVKGNTFDMQFETQEFDEKMEFNEFHNRIAAGIVGGPGLSLDITENISVELDALYYYDLTSYIKISDVAADPRYNNTMSLTLGLIYKM